MKALTQVRPYPLALKLVGQRERLLWPSWAEVRFMRLMGCWVIPMPFLKHPTTGQTAYYVIMRGIMKREHMQREVMARGYCLDFGNDIGRGIEIDGGRHDVVADYERDQHLAKDGWIVHRIPVDRLKRSPSRVRREAIDFLEH